MIRLTVNGVARQFDGDPEMPLLWYLRDELRGVYIGIEPSGTVIIVAHRSEMGTGIRTELAK